jgi:hypothetical protein
VRKRTSDTTLAVCINVREEGVIPEDEDCLVRSIRILSGVVRGSVELSDDGQLECAVAGKTMKKAAEAKQAVFKLVKHKAEFRGRGVARRRPRRKPGFVNSPSLAQG